MGGGDRRDRLERSDEYRDPEPDDVDESDAQRRLDALETPSSQQSDLTALPGIGPVKARTLREAGYETPDDIRQARRSDLTTVTGIGWSLAGKLKHAVGAQTVQDRDPSDPPGEMVMPVKSEGIGTNHVIANGIRVDTNSVEFVELRYHRGTYYYGLTADEFDRIQQQLTAKHGEAPVENVLTETHNWKESSGTPSAQTHEETFKNALRIDAPIRDTGGEPRRIGADAPEVAVARDLAAISRVVVKNHLDQEFTLTRGLGFGLPGIATEMLDKPEQLDYGLNPTALTNFTLDDRTATAYFEVIAQIQTTPEDVALAPDILIRHRSGGDGELVSDGEVQIRAETVRTVDRESIVISQNEQTIADVFEAVPSSIDIEQQVARLEAGPDAESIFSLTTHNAIAETVRLMGAASRNEARAYTGVTTQQASQTLHNWLDLYEIEANPSTEVWQELNDDILELTKHIED